MDDDDDGDDDIINVLKQNRYQKLVINSVIPFPPPIIRGHFPVVVVVLLVLQCVQNSLLPCPPRGRLGKLVKVFKLTHSTL